MCAPAHRMGEGPLKRIIFLTHRNPQGYRIQQYFPFLERKGFEVELITTNITFLGLMERVRKCDVLYIQRLLMSPLKLRVLRSLAKRMVYDFDDAVMYGPKGESATRRRKFRRMVETVDAVLCGNRFLLSEAARFRKDGIHYVPTVVDTAEYPVKEHTERQTATAGWMGSSSTLKYMADMRGLMASLAARGRCSFTIVADKPLEPPMAGLTFSKWEKEKEKALLLGFDMGLMPLTDDIWSRGKCGLKLIQYMAAGLPSVTHPVGASLEIVDDGIDGFLGKGDTEWAALIERLAGDTELRKKAGRLAREKVEARYSLSVWGPKVTEIMDSL